MKRLIFILSVGLLIVSCTKQVECCTTRTTVFKDKDELNGVNIYCEDFEGTTEEIHQYEKDNTTHFYSQDFTVDKEVTCLKK